MGLRDEGATKGSRVVLKWPALIGAVGGRVEAKASIVRVAPAVLGPKAHRLTDMASRPSIVVAGVAHDLTQLGRQGPVRRAQRNLPLSWHPDSVLLHVDDGAVHEDRRVPNCDLLSRRPRCRRRFRVSRAQESPLSAIRLTRTVLLTHPACSRFPQREEPDYARHTRAD